MSSLANRYLSALLSRPLGPRPRAGYSFWQRYWASLTGGIPSQRRHAPDRQASARAVTAAARPRRSRERKVIPAFSSVLVTAALRFHRMGPLAALTTTLATVTATGVALSGAVAANKPPILVVGVIIGIIVLILLTALWRRRVYRKRFDVRGLTAILDRGGEQISLLRPPNRWSDTFYFTIRDTQMMGARLGYPEAGSSVFKVMRVGTGKVMVTAPTGMRYSIVAADRSGVPLEDYGVDLAFADTRRRRKPPRRSGSASQGGRSGHASMPQFRVPGFPETADSTQAQKDDWW